MNLQVIFETPKPGLGWGGYLIIGIFLLICFLVAFFWKRNDKSGKIALIVVLIITCCIVGTIFYSYFNQEQNIYNKYKNGDYKIVEGIINDYQSMNIEEGWKRDSFTLEDVEFYVPSLFSFGYSLMQEEGSPLENGMYVKIYYVPYRGENVIMKIEALKE